VYAKDKKVAERAYLAAVNIIALRLPNVEAATNRGMHQAITPNILSANVCVTYQHTHYTSGNGISQGKLVDITALMSTEVSGAKFV